MACIRALTPMKLSRGFLTADSLSRTVPVRCCYCRRKNTGGTLSMRMTRRSGPVRPRSHAGGARRAGAGSIAARRGQPVRDREERKLEAIRDADLLKDGGE